MSAGAFFVGLALFSLIVVPPFVGARLVLRWRMPSASGSVTTLAAAVVGIALISTVCEILGSFGEFRPWAVMGSCLVLGAGLAAIALRATRHERTHRRLLVTRSPIAVLAVLAGAAVVAAWTTRALVAWNGGIVDIDSLQYHLPFAATFAQTGSVVQPHYAWLDPVWTFYPFNTELFHAVAILAFGRDVLSPALNLGWLGLALLGAWCFGRARGVSAPCMVLALGVLGSPLLVVTQAGTANADIGGLAMLLCAAALLVVPTPTTATYALAGTAAGLAASTSLEFLPVVAGLSLGTLVADRLPVPFRRRAFVAGLLLTGSFWFVRNWAQIGNPFPSIRSIGPLRLPGPPLPAVARYGFSVVHYAGSGRFWRHTVLPGLHAAFGPAWPLVVILAVAGVCACLLPSATRELRPVGIAAATALVVYPLTPTTAYGPPGDPFLFAPNLRFATAGLVLGLTALPVAAASISRTRPRLNHVVAGRYPVWLVAVFTAGSVVVASNIGTGFGGAVRWLDGGSKKALGFGALALAGALACTARRAAYRAVAVLTVVAVMAAAGFAAQRHYLTRRYSSSAVSIDAWARSVSHHRIGIVAYAEQYPLFGLDLSNRVSYVGSRGPEGALVRASTCQQWRQQLAVGGYSYVVVGVNDWMLAPIREAQWTTSDPAAREVLHTADGTVFSVDSGQPSRAGCSARLTS